MVKVCSSCFLNFSGGFDLKCRNSPIGSDFLSDLDLVHRFFRKKTDVYLPVGCLKRTKQPLKFEVEDSKPEFPFHAPSFLVSIR